MNKNKVYFKDGHSEDIMVLEIINRWYLHVEKFTISFVLNDHEYEYRFMRELEYVKFGDSEYCIPHICYGFFDESNHRVDHIDYITVEGVDNASIRLPN